MTLTMPTPICSLQACLLYGQSIGLPEIECHKFYDYFESVGWLVGGRAKMKNFEAGMRNWHRRWQEQDRSAYVARLQPRIEPAEPGWAKEKRLRAELDQLRAKLFRLGDVSPVHSHEQAAAIRAQRRPIIDAIKKIKTELGLL